MTTILTKLRWRIGAVMVAALALANGSVGQAQSTPTSSPQEPRVERYIYYGHTAVRVWQNYQLGSGDGARDVVVVAGDAVIDGQVNGDVHVMLGTVRLGRTAVIDGSLIVAGGDVWITDGAVVRRDLAVVGGVIHAPTAFAPGGSHFILGADRLGQGLRALAPWFSRGLLWGRLIVPSLGWVWAVVFTMLIVTLALNVLLHRPVGAAAATLASRPLSAFMTGLLVLLLAGPLSAILAVTIVGIALIPFFLCAVIVAWIVGKVGVARWIGATIMPSESDSRLAAMRAVLIGFTAVTLMYMVPVLGLMSRPGGKVPLPFTMVQVKEGVPPCSASCCV